VAEFNTHIVRKITPGGEVSTLAGSGASGHADGIGTAATFSESFGIAVDSAGNVYVADTYNENIRKITPDGIVTTLAGQAGVSGFANGSGNVALFSNPVGITVDSSDNIYVSDRVENSIIRKITPGGMVTTLAGQKGVEGSTNGPAITATFSLPWGISVDVSGNVFVADYGNQLIRKIQVN
jgi:sugar lactone lactonase YvrE